MYLEEDVDRRNSLGKTCGATSWASSAHFARRIVVHSRHYIAIFSFHILTTMHFRSFDLGGAACGFVTWWPVRCRPFCDRVNGKTSDSRPVLRRYLNSGVVRITFLNESQGKDILYLIQARYEISGWLRFPGPVFKDWGVWIWTCYRDKYGMDPAGHCDG